jgi:hypothetical protein
VKPLSVISKVRGGKATWENNARRKALKVSKTKQQQRIKIVKFSLRSIKTVKAVSLHAMEALVGRGGIAPTHSRPRH